MADSSSIPKQVPTATQTASSGLRLAADETNLATQPVGTEDSTTTKEQADSRSGAKASATTSSSANGVASAVTGVASNAASTAAAAASSASTTAVNAAVGVKDNVFSMFGGGPKKEKKVEEEDVDEPSGSSKAKKAAAADDEVCLPNIFKFVFLISAGQQADVFHFDKNRRIRNVKSTFILNLLYISPRRSSKRPTKNKKNKSLRCAPSFSVLIVRVANGRNVVREMFDC